MVNCCAGATLRAACWSYLLQPELYLIHSCSCIHSKECLLGHVGKKCEDSVWFYCILIIKCTGCNTSMSLLVYKYDPPFLKPQWLNPLCSCASHSYLFSDDSCLWSFTELWAKEALISPSLTSWEVDSLTVSVLYCHDWLTFCGYNKQVLKKIWLTMSMTKGY